MTGTTTVSTEPTWAPGSTVYDISTDCLNVALEPCGIQQCDAWITGSFVATPPSTIQNARTAYNIIKFDAGSTSWDYVAGGVGGASNPEYVGYTIFKHFENIIVGGNFGGKNMKTTSKRNYNWVDLGTATFDGPVRAMYYKYNVGINVDEIYIGGAFATTPAPYLVKYSYKTNSYTPLLNPTGPVYEVRYSYLQSILYIGGDFITSTARYAGRLPNEKFTRWASISDFGLNEDLQRNPGSIIRSMSVCGLTSIDCTPGSVAMVGLLPDTLPVTYDNSTYSGAAFYDSSIGVMYGLGGGVNGNLYGVATTFLGSASQSSISSIVLLVIMFFYYYCIMN